MEHYSAVMKRVEREKKKKKKQKHNLNKVSQFQDDKYAMC